MNKDTNQKKKKDRSVLIIAIIALFLVFGASYAIMSPIMHKVNYETFTNDLTRSINDAREHGKVTVTRGEDTYIMDEDNLSWMYSLIVNMGVGNRTSQTPENTIIISFPDGSELTLGDVTVENGVRKGRTGLYVSFKNTKGKTYSYYSDMADTTSFEDL